jgi:RNA polymerase sigma-70 factor (ECF subfamily)
VYSLSPTFVESAIPENRSLLQQAQGGDVEAFGGLCRIYEKRLFRQAAALCGNTALAEDLAQDTLVEAWKSLRRYNGRCQFYTWLCAILVNRYRNILREKRPVPFSTLAADDENEVQRGLDQTVHAEPLPDQCASLREEAALVRQCIQALPPKHQQIILLRFYVDDSLEGIAAALGCSVGTVKSRLFHALEKLRSMQAMSRHFNHLESKALSL